MSGILVAHSSALCHPADMCYICMAAGDPWIKCLQQYCHISFNNIIILCGKQCFMPDASCAVPPLSLSISLCLLFSPLSKAVATRTLDQPTKKYEPHQNKSLKD